MRPFFNLHGFGSFLEDEEVVEGIFRQKFSYAFSNILVKLLLWWGWAWVFWFFYPVHLAPVYLALAFGGLIHGIILYVGWYYNAILMTNMNVMIVKWEKPLEKTLTRIDYWNLDEIVVEKKGWGAFMYHYGTLIFQKLSDGEPIRYEHIGFPTKVATIIDDYKEKVVHERNFSSDAGIKDMLVDALGRHIDGNTVSAPPSLQNRISKASTDGFTIKKPKEVEHYRSHWSHFVPWMKKEPVLAQTTVEADDTAENLQHSSDNIHTHSQKTVIQHENPVGKTEIHHHHHYSGHHAPISPSFAHNTRPFTPQSPQDVNISQFSNEYEENLDDFPHSDESSVHVKPLDDRGGISVEI